MSALWLAVLVLAGTPVASTSAGDSTAPVDVGNESTPLVPPRTGAKLEEAAREALRRWARPSDKEADQAAREFLVLYQDIQRDTQLARAQREQLRLKVRGRLAALAQQIAKRAATERRLAGSERPKTVDAAKGERPLAQFGGFGQQRGGGGAQGGMPGGMGMPMAGGAGAAVVNDDYGEDLVDVIQKTISPPSWDVNGGPGSIYYWRPGRSIVVRAGQDVHEDITDLLDQLNRAGR